MTENGVETLGPASEACATATAQLVGDTNYIVTYRQETSTVGAFDLTTRRVEDTVELPLGNGSWASTLLGDHDVFIGSYSPARLYHLDTRDMSVTEVADPETHKIHAVDTVPGEETVVFGTKPAQIVYEYDHDTGAVRDYGQAVPDEKFIRSIAATPDTIFAGIGSHAHLVAIDRTTGEKTEFLPPELRDDSHVRDVQLTPDSILIATNGGNMAIIDRDEYSSYRIHRFSEGPDPAGVHLLHHVPGTDRLFVADGAGMGRVLQYDLSSHTHTVLVSDVFGARELDTWGDSLVCTSDSQGVFVYDVDGTGVSLHQSTGYREAGLPHRPEEVQSLEADEGRVYVGGHRGTAIHDLGDGTMSRISHRGEPKAMTVVDGDLYQAIYPRAKLRRYTPETGAYEELAEIGHDQNRPRSIQYHDPSGRLLVGTRPQYGKLGGVLATFDPTGEALVDVERDVFPDQSVTALTSVGDLVYVGSEIYGGGGSDPTTECATLGAWDPVERSLRWSADLPGVTELISLASHEGQLYGLTSGYSNLGKYSETELLSIETPSGSVDRLAELGTARGGELRPYGDTLIGVTTDELFQYHPDGGRVDSLLTGLDPTGNDWHNFPQMGVDSDGAIYVVGERMLRRRDAPR